MAWMLEHFGKDEDAERWIHDLNRRPLTPFGEADVWDVSLRAAVSRLRRFNGGDAAPAEQVPAGWDNDALLRESMHALTEL